MTLRELLTRHERISELLRLFGTGAIELDEFWAQMRAYGLDDDDIDKFCRGEIISDVGETARRPSKAAKQGR